MRIIDRKMKGFTFIELMVVISIMAILVGAGIVTYTGTNKRSRDARRKTDIEQVRSALEMYRADNGSYPIQICADESCPIEVVDLTELDNYLPKYPSDPDGTTQYLYYPKNIQPVGGVDKAFAYCLYAVLEQTTVDDLSGCTDIRPDSSGDYAVKNP